MPFNFGGPNFPIALKFARSLLISEAILFLFAALISLLLAIANGGTAGAGSSSTSVSPVLLVVSLIAAALLIYLALDLRNLRPMTRNVIVATQLVLLVSTLVTSITEPLSLALVIALVAGVLYCLLLDKGAQAAFATGAVTGNSSPGVAAAKAKTQDEKVQEILDKAAARDAEQKLARENESKDGESAEKAGA